VRTAGAIKEAKARFKVFIEEASHNATAAASVNRRQRTPDHIASTQSSINVLLEPLITGAVQLE